MERLHQSLRINVNQIYMELPQDDPLILHNWIPSSDFSIFIILYGAFAVFSLTETATSCPAPIYLGYVEWQTAITPYYGESPANQFAAFCLLISALQCVVIITWISEMQKPYSTMQKTIHVSCYRDLIKYIFVTPVAWGPVFLAQMTRNIVHVVSLQKNGNV